MPLVPNSSLFRFCFFLTFTTFCLAELANSAAAQTMMPTVSETALSVMPNPDGSVTFTANITTDDRTQPVGSLKIVDESAETLIGIVDALQPSIRVRDLAPGTHEIRAYYSGSDGVFPYLTEPSVSVPLIYKVRAAPNVDLSVLQDGSGSQLVTLKATVTGQGGPARGRVVFREDERILAVQALDSDGQTSFITSALDEGSHRIAAEYQGNEVLAPAVSFTRIADIGAVRFHNAMIFRRAVLPIRVISSN